MLLLTLPLAPIMLLLLALLTGMCPALLPLLLLLPLLFMPPTVDDKTEAPLKFPPQFPIPVVLLLLLPLPAILLLLLLRALLPVIGAPHAAEDDGNIGEPPAACAAAAAIAATYRWNILYYIRIRIFTFSYPEVTNTLHL